MTSSPKTKSSASRDGDRETGSPQKASPKGAGRVGRWIGNLALVGVAGVATVGLALGLALAVAYPNLPDVTDLADYRPKLPLRVFTADGKLMGEFGEERRNLTPFEDIPPVMVNAVLAIEDSRFFEHSGVDYRGILRAALANLGEAKSQGASTITMQVARNVYLSTEKSYLRKIYEVLLTFKLEHLLTKEQILEIYMNQIFLGHRAYGFAAASQVYFGKPLKNVSIAEAAMLAGLPKAPSAFNPISNPRRARSRQLHIIDQMLENGFITAEEAVQAKEEELRIRRPGNEPVIHGDYAAEMARAAVFAQYGEDAYTRGLHVYTTIDSRAQAQAYRALRRGVLDFERRQFYRGPERFIDLPTDPAAREAAIDEVMAETPDNGELMTAVVLEASPKRVLLVRGDDEPFEITGAGLQPVQSGLAERAPPNLKIRPGAVVRVVNTGKDRWEITQQPEVEAALVALDPRTGAIRSLVGGFDFQRNKFNRVTQAWRQPGSAFKPFIYSAALEKGIGPATIVNDKPLFYSAEVTGGKPWEPRNYDGTFEGPMTVRTALARSKNMVSITVLEAVGTQSAQQWVSRFGFDPARHPPYLTMALGAGSVTPLQMATGYGAFANGGYLVPPMLITRVTDHRGRVLLETPPRFPDESQRVISERNAFMMAQMLQEITRSGTAARAQSVLKRPDLYGKTGTTNDAVDAWFVGYQPTLVAAAWVGYDNPRNLGRRETGGGLALPIWLSYMSSQLEGVPVSEPAAPPGVVYTSGEWFYEEFTPGQGVASLGLTEEDQSGGFGGLFGLPEGAQVLPPMEPQDRRSILDLFRN